MKLKKINAVVARIVSIDLALHIVCTVISMLFGFKIYIVHKVLAEATAIPMFIHALLSIYIVFVVQKGPIFKGYKKENLRTLIQRDTGLITLIATFWHMNALKFMAENVAITKLDAVKFIIAEILFFLVSIDHTANSFSKSLISTGKISSDAQLKKVEKITLITCGVLFVLAMLGVIMYISRYEGIIGG